MTNDDLQRRIESSPELQKLCARLTDAVHFHADASVQFDPLLVVSIISVIVNVLIACRDKSTAELKEDIRNIRTIPLRKLIRLRRQLNTLWQKQGISAGTANAPTNPILTALYEFGELADDEQLDALLSLVPKK